MAVSMMASTQQCVSLPLGSRRPSQLLACGPRAQRCRTQRAAHTLPAVASERKRRASVVVSASAQDGTPQEPFEPQVCVVLGTQWGDEGKGKLVDILAQQYDVVARAQASDGSGARRGGGGCGGSAGGKQQCPQAAPERPARPPRRRVAPTQATPSMTRPATSTSCTSSRAASSTPTRRASSATASSCTCHPCSRRSAACRSAASASRAGCSSPTARTCCLTCTRKSTRHARRSSPAQASVVPLRAPASTARAGLGCI
jgi:hypothetical protein